MGTTPQQIGWSQEAKLLQEILKEIKRLQSIVNKLVVTTTSTTTAAP